MSPFKKIACFPIFCLVFSLLALACAPCAYADVTTGLKPDLPPISQSYSVVTLSLENLLADDEVSILVPVLPVVGHRDSSDFQRATQEQVRDSKAILEQFSADGAARPGITDDMVFVQNWKLPSNFTTLLGGAIQNDTILADGKDHVEYRLARKLGQPRDRLVFCAMDDSLDDVTVMVRAEDGSASVFPVKLSEAGERNISLDRAKMSFSMPNADEGYPSQPEPVSQAASSVSAQPSDAVHSSSTTTSDATNSLVLTGTVIAVVMGLVAAAAAVLIVVLTRRSKAK